MSTISYTFARRAYMNASNIRDHSRLIAKSMHNYVILLWIYYFSVGKTKWFGEQFERHFSTNVSIEEKQREFYIQWSSQLLIQTSNSESRRRHASDWLDLDASAGFEARRNCSGDGSLGLQRQIRQAEVSYYGNNNLIELQRMQLLLPL